MAIHPKVVDIQVPQRMNPNDIFLKSKNAKFMVTTDLRDHQTTIWWIAMKIVTDIHIPLSMNCNYFGDPLIFHLIPLVSQKFKFTNTLV